MPSLVQDDRSCHNLTKIDSSWPVSGDQSADSSKLQVAIPVVLPQFPTKILASTLWYWTGRLGRACW